MAYSYQQHKNKVFKPVNQKIFLQIRDHIHRILRLSGAIMLERVVIGLHTDTEDQYLKAACVDRLQELGEIKEVYGQGLSRIFVRDYNEDRTNNPA